MYYSLKNRIINLMIHFCLLTRDKHPGVATGGKKGYGDSMKKIISVILAVMMLMSAAATVNAEDKVVSSPSFMTVKALYAHAVSGSADTEAWHMWQSVHDEDFNISAESEKYFFLPSSVSSDKVEIYNGFDSEVTFDGIKIAAGEVFEFPYIIGDDYAVSANGKDYTLKFMKSSAEAAIFVNNKDADGEGTELMQYLYQDKSLSAKATGAIVTPDGEIDNTPIKKIKGRGNTTWWKPKRPFNITYDSKVSIAGMDKSKKFSMLANYQDDSLSRNRILYDLSDAVGMPYASDSRFVDFYSDGMYLGSYQLTEKIDVGKDSLIPDFSEDDYLDENGNVKEDFPFLCEVDASATEGEDYFVTLSNRTKITIKAPELEEGDVGYEEVMKYVKDKFEAFYNACNSRSKDLSEFADVNSLASIYLINELGKNWDSGVSSLYFTYKPDENGQFKFYGSPVWDYDNSLGNAVGVENDLKNMGVTDYEEYTGWWCRLKGKSKSQKSSTNIMNRLAQNTGVLNSAKEIWFSKFVPAIDHFEGNTIEDINKELYTAEEYFSLIKGSAEMNYASGWLLNTGSWIADHSSLNLAIYDKELNTYATFKKANSYNSNFDDMFYYCRDWMLSRAAWLSKEMADVKPKEVEIDEPAEETSEPTESVPDTTAEPTESAPDTTAEPTESVPDTSAEPTSPDTTIEPTEPVSQTPTQPAAPADTKSFTSSGSSKFILELTGTKFVYSGKTITPLVSYKAPDGTSFHPSFLDIRYSAGRTEVGTYKVTVGLKGFTLSDKTAEFTIVPKSTSISKVKRSKNNKTATIKWKKASGSITGYQVVYSKSKKFTKATKKTVKSKTSLKIKKLKKKNYYVKLRVYKTVGGKTYYSDWSKAKKIAVK